MLFIERSNRTERLLEGLTRRLMVPRPDPLTPSLVVVQGMGMERWIAQRIADECGVCANVEFLFPQRLWERVLSAFEDNTDSGTAPSPEVWQPESLMWWVADRLLSVPDTPVFAPLARHLDSEDGDWRRIQLAHQIASLFDHYITYRPEWVLGWSEGRAVDALADDQDQRWQSELFAELASRLGPGHLAARVSQFCDAVGGADGRADSAVARALVGGIPSRIEVFAISSLPPLHLTILDALARVRDVHLSVVSPSSVYWAGMQAELRDEGDVGAGGHNATRFLLAGLGRLGGDFQSLLETHAERRGSDEDLFEDPAPADAADTPSLLARLQSNLLALRDDPTVEGGSRDVAVDDRSIRVHLCHGPIRELEVLQAALHAAFERDATLRPEDVIVMTPRIDALASSIEAVFGAALGGPAGIPYRIADRGTLGRSPVADAFCALLEMLTGRATRSEVLDWLARAPVHERFGLDTRSMESLTRWAEEAGIRFGLDERHRAALGLPPESRHDWSAGIDRLVLAHAFGEGETVVRGERAVGLDAFSDREILGVLGDLEATLSEARNETTRPRPVAEWARFFETLLDAALLRDDANNHEHASIRDVLVSVAEAAENAGFDSAIPFEAMRERVRRALEATPPPQGFLAGGVTFCELVPLRAIPFRVVALLGMGDAEFPRPTSAPGFDLMLRHPQPGDRSTRNDDRYLFLEALLSARDQLIITVPARDLRDDSELPPSVVVSELLDAIDASFRLESEGDPEKLRDRLVVSHPLHAFDPVCFGADPVEDRRSFDRDAYQGALAREAAIAAGGGTPRVFLDAALAVPIQGDSQSETPSPRLSLDALVERLLRSTRYFARDRLGIRLNRPSEAVEDLDPLEFGALDQYRLGLAALDQLRAGVPRDRIAEGMMALANRPAGVVGSIAVDRLRDEVDDLLHAASLHAPAPARPDARFELRLESGTGAGALELHGRLDGLTEEGRLVLDFSRSGRRREYETWLRHLVLCALAEAEPELGLVPLSTFLTRPSTDGKRSVLFFDHDPQARTRLAQLFEWAWSADEAPLPFFPKASRKFATGWEKDPRKARTEAINSYWGLDGDRHSMPEHDEGPEHALVWDGIDPIRVEGAADPVQHGFDALALEIQGWFDDVSRAEPR